MNVVKIKKVKLRAKQVLLFMFVPWPAFLNQKPSLQDHMHLNLGFSTRSDCSTIESKTTAELAVSSIVQAKGLSFRKTSLKSEESMAFVYSEPRILEFWMKETYIPLQISFFDSNGKLVNLFEMPIEPEPSQPKKLYPSKRHAIIAIETPPGKLKLKQSNESQSYYLCVEHQAPSH